MLVNAKRMVATTRKPYVMCCTCRLLLDEMVLVVFLYFLSFRRRRHSLHVELCADSMKNEAAAQWWCTVWTMDYMYINVQCTCIALRLMRIQNRAFI